jgi:D-beta-D-heptose 7-phosphate kinase/D-beta-D-heptose 1-phosphate adenosyltransferase
MERNIKITNIENTIAKFRNAKIAVFGDLMLDVYIWGKAVRISQEAPVQVVQVKKQEYSPGGASNVIRNLSAHGAEVHAYGAIGNDEFALKLIKLLEKERAITDGIRFLKDRGTVRKERVIAGTQQLLRIDYEETEDLKSPIRDSIVNDILDKIKKRQFDAVIIEDYAKGLVNAESVEKIAGSCSKAGIICGLDPHPSHPFNVKGITYMTPNRQEAFALAGVFCPEKSLPPSSDPNLRNVAKKLTAKWQPRELLITLGADGMALFDKKNRVPKIIPTKAREVFDVSGAGDTVIAIYTLSLVAGAGKEEAAEIANHAAGVVVGKIGTATASPNEIIESFKRH